MSFIVNIYSASFALFQAVSVSLFGLVINTFASLFGQNSFASNPVSLHISTFTWHSHCFVGAVPWTKNSVYPLSPLGSFAQFSVTSNPESLHTFAVTTPDGLVCANVLFPKLACAGFITPDHICPAGLKDHPDTVSLLSYPYHTAAE